ncbi:hypothetical protein GCM10020256_69630 [Streptomyces thermocoprophilus]
MPPTSSRAEASASGTPGPERLPSSTRSAVVGTGVFDPFGMDIGVPIPPHPASPRRAAPGARSLENLPNRR